MAEYLNKELFLQSMGLLGDETKYGNRDGEHQSRSYGTWMGYEIMDSVEDSVVEEDVVEVVRCKDCKHFKPAHFKADDGTETPWDETFNWDDRSDGIYHGGKCKHDRSTAYGQKDMAFRKPDDFCSYGERREGE